MLRRGSVKNELSLAKIPICGRIKYLNSAQFSSF